MSKESSTWHSPRVNRKIQLARWGEVGTPVLVFPTAGGDAEECERFHLIGALAPLLEAGRIKAYSVDSVAGKAWVTESNSAATAARIQNQFDACIYHEVVPAIRQDCGDPDIEVIVTGASIGAFNAVAALCRHPDVFSHAIGMSGTYDLQKFLQGPKTKDYYESSPLDFVPDLPDDGDQLAALRERFVLLTHGQGRWEEPAQSWRMADTLGKRGIPNRVDPWGDQYDHDWPTWREMLPQYLNELLGD